MEPRRKYLGRFRLLEEDGPAVLVLCLSHRCGRWHKELSQAGTRHVGEQLAQEAERLQNLGEADDMWRVQGLMVMSAWRLVQAVGTAFPTQWSFSTGMDSRQIMQNLLLYQCAAGVQAAVEFPVLAASYFTDPHPLEVPHGYDFHDYSVNLDTATFAVGAWNAVSHLDNIIEVQPDGGQRQPCSVQALWRRWSNRYCLPTTSQGLPSLVGWRVWSPIACLMCHGRWYGDACAIQRRASGRFACRLRTDAPPAHLLREYLLLKAHSRLFSSFFVSVVLLQASSLPKVNYLCANLKSF